MREDLKERAKKAAESYLLGIQPTLRRKAVFTAGLPGTGKSRILRKAIREKDFVVIDPDDLKPYFYDYANDSGEIHAAAGLCACLVRNACIEKGAGYVLDSTMTSIGNVRVELGKARDAGYDVEICAISASLTESVLGVVERFFLYEERGLRGRIMDFEWLKERAFQFPFAMEEAARYRPVRFMAYDADENPILYAEREEIDASVLLRVFGSAERRFSEKMHGDRLAGKIFIERSERAISKMEKAIGRNPNSVFVKYLEHLNSFLEGISREREAEIRGAFCNPSV